MARCKSSSISWYHQWQQDWGVTLQDTTLVRQIEVDYLRVYQQTP